MKYGKIIGFALILFGIFLVVSTHSTVHKVQADSYQDDFIKVTTNDISNAGYNGISQQQRDGVNYQLPNQYFWVAGASEKNTMPDGNFDLLMVSQYTDGTSYTADLFDYGTTSSPINISGARAQETILNDGRTALNFAKGNYYIVIIGPNSSRVEALANIVAGKI